MVLRGINLGVYGIRIKIHQAFTVFLEWRDATYATSDLAIRHPCPCRAGDICGLFPKRRSDSGAADRAGSD